MVVIDLGKMIVDDGLIVGGTRINVCLGSVGACEWLDRESFEGIDGCVRISCEEGLRIVSMDGNGSDELTTTNWREISGEDEGLGGWWIT